MSSEREILLAHNVHSGNGLAKKTAEQVKKQGVEGTHIETMDIRTLWEALKDGHEGVLAGIDDLFVLAGDGSKFHTANLLAQINGKTPVLGFLHFGGEGVGGRMTIGDRDHTQALSHWAQGKSNLPYETGKAYVTRTLQDAVRGALHIKTIHPGTFQTESMGKVGLFSWLLTPSRGMSTEALRKVEMLRGKIHPILRSPLAVGYAAADLRDKIHPVEIFYRDEEIIAAEVSLNKAPFTQWTKLLLSPDQSQDTMLMIAPGNPDISARGLAAGLTVDVAWGVALQKAHLPYRSATGTLVTKQLHPEDTLTIVNRDFRRPTVHAVDSELVSPRIWREMDVHVQDKSRAVNIYTRRK